MAAAATVVLTRDGHEGRTHPMTGPQSLTRLAQLETIGAAIGRQLDFTESTPEQFGAPMSRYGVPTEVVAILLDHWRDTVDEPDVVRSPERVTGRSARTLAEWASGHAAAFTAS